MSLSGKKRKATEKDLETYRSTHGDVAESIKDKVASEVERLTEEVEALKGYRGKFENMLVEVNDLRVKMVRVDIERIQVILASFQPFARGYVEKSLRTLRREHSSEPCAGDTINERTTMTEMMRHWSTCKKHQTPVQVVVAAKVKGPDEKEVEVSADRKDVENALPLLYGELSRGIHYRKPTHGLLEIAELSDAALTLALETVLCHEKVPHVLCSQRCFA